MYSWGLRFESKSPSDVMIGTLFSGSGRDMSVCVRTVRHMHFVREPLCHLLELLLLFPILPLLWSACALT